MALQQQQPKPETSSLFETCVDRVRCCEVTSNSNFNANQTTKTSLQRHWRKATCEVLDSQLQEEQLALWFERLWDMHTNDRTRHYHTAIHLLEMCTLLEEVLVVLTIYRDVGLPSLSTKDIPIIILAIFFHDAVYNGKSSTNEEDSATLFQEFVAEVGLDKKVESAVVEMIIATKTHKILGSFASSDACSLFLDLDMAVLGKEADAYHNYAGLIRTEYSFVQHNIYCEKRAEILREFLRDNIFGTRLFREAFEARARTNLESEIESLKAGNIPGDRVERSPLPTLMG